MEIYRKDVISATDISNIECELTEYIRQTIPVGVIGFYMKAGLPLCYLDDEMLRLIGYHDYQEFAEVTQEKIEAVLLPRDYRFIKNYLKMNIGRQEPVSFEHRFLRKDKTEFWVKSYAKKLLDRDGQAAVLLVCVLIQDQKDYEEQSIELALYKDGSQGGTFRILLDEQLTILSANDLFYQIHGYTKQQAELELNNQARQFIYSDDYPVVSAKMDKVILENERYLFLEMRIVKRSGEIRWIFVSGYLLEENEDCFILEGFAMDCTERKQAEIAMKLSEERYRVALERTKTYVWDYDFAKKCLIQTKRSIEINGLPEIIENVPESLIARNYIHPESIDDFLRLYKEIHSGESYASAIYRARDKNGEYWWEKVSYTVIFDDEGNPLRAIGVSEDVSIREESENRYRRELVYRDAITPDLYVSYKVNLTKDSVQPYKVDKEKQEEIVLVNSYEALLDAEMNKIPDAIEKEKNYTILGYHELIRAFKEGKAAILTEYHRKDAKQCVVWVRTIVKLTTDPQTGDVIAFIYINNIDEYKRAELEQRNLIQRYESEIRSSYDAVYEIDYNRDTANQLSFEKGGMKKIPIGDGSLGAAKKDWLERCLPGPGRDECERLANVHILTKVFSSGCPEISYTVQRREDESSEYLWYTYWIRKVEWKDPGEKIAMLYMKNVDAERRQQEEHSKVLKAALGSAERANQAKSDFLSRMSHDIRTPMNAIMGMASIAKECLHTPDRVAECLNKIDLSAKYLLSLINDVLDVSKIESGKMVIHREEFQMSKFLRELDELCKEKAAEKNIDFRIKKDAAIENTLVGDVLHLNQILINLLSNAFQYTNAGGNVILEIQELEKKTNSTILRFIVKDNGIGIKPEFIGKIFQPFEQDTNRIVSKVMGTGLGLAIVYSLVKLMDGVVHVSSKVDVGSTFTVEIPFGLIRRRFLMSVEEEVDVPIIRRKYFFNNERILLVEDNEINQEIAEVFLEEVNLNTETAVNGKIAVDKFAASPIGYYHLILMDIRMPVMDGREATKLIREMKRADAHTIPIVALSADAFSEDVKYSERIGMNDYIVKPVNKDRLYSVLDKFLVK